MPFAAVVLDARRRARNARVSIDKILNPNGKDKRRAARLQLVEYFRGEKAAALLASPAFEDAANRLLVLLSPGGLDAHQVAVGGGTVLDKLIHILDVSAPAAAITVDKMLDVWLPAPAADSVQEYAALFADSMRFQQPTQRQVGKPDDGEKLCTEMVVWASAMREVQFLRDKVLGMSASQSRDTAGGWAGKGRGRILAEHTVLPRFFNAMEKQKWIPRWVALSRTKEDPKKTKPGSVSFTYLGRSYEHSITHALVDVAVGGAGFKWEDVVTKYLGRKETVTAQGGGDAKYARVASAHSEPCAIDLLDLLRKYDGGDSWLTNNLRKEIDLTRLEDWLRSDHSEPSLDKKAGGGCANADVVFASNSKLLQMCLQDAKSKLALKFEFEDEGISKTIAVRRRREDSFAQEMIASVLKRGATSDGSDAAGGVGAGRAASRQSSGEPEPGTHTEFCHRCSAWTTCADGNAVEATELSLEHTRYQCCTPGCGSVLRIFSAETVLVEAFVGSIARERSDGRPLRRLLELARWRVAVSKALGTDTALLDKRHYHAILVDLQAKARRCGADECADCGKPATHSCVDCAPAHQTGQQKTPVSFCARCSAPHLRGSTIKGHRYENHQLRTRKRLQADWNLLLDHSGAAAAPGEAQRRTSTAVLSQAEADDVAVKLLLAPFGVVTNKGKKVLPLHLRANSDEPPPVPAGGTADEPQVDLNDFSGSVNALQGELKAWFDDDETTKMHIRSIQAGLASLQQELSMHSIVVTPDAVGCAVGPESVAVVEAADVKGFRLPVQVSCMHPTARHVPSRIALHLIRACAANLTLFDCPPHPYTPFRTRVRARARAKSKWRTKTDRQDEVEGLEEKLIATPAGEHWWSSDVPAVIVAAPPHRLCASVFTWNVLAEMLSSSQLKFRTWQKLAWSARWPMMQEVLKRYVLGTECPILCLQEVQESNVDELNHRAQIQCFLEEQGMVCMYAAEKPRPLNATIRKELIDDGRMQEDSGKRAPLSATGPFKGSEAVAGTESAAAQHCETVFSDKEQSQKFCKGQLVAWRQADWELVEGVRPVILRTDQLIASDEVCQSIKDALRRQHSRKGAKGPPLDEALLEEACIELGKKISGGTGAASAIVALQSAKAPSVRMIVATMHPPVPIGKIKGTDMNEHFFLPGLFQARKTLDAVVEMQAAVVKATTTSVYEPPRPAVVLCGDLNSKPRQATCRYLERAELARGDGQELTAELVTSYQWGKSTSPLFAHRDV